MKEGSRWTLPVVYVPRWEADDLIEVLVEEENVNGFHVVFYWFHWTHDWRLPPFNQPEYEPLAIAYLEDRPVKCFWRPHNDLASGIPVLYKGVPLVYVSPLGHPPRVTKYWVIASLLTEPLIIFGKHLLHKRVDTEKFRLGSPPERADLWRGTSFREFVRKQLRPENVNSDDPATRSRLLRFLWHTFKASQKARAGDLEGFYRHLVKGFLTMPPHLKRTEIGCTFISDILGAKSYLTHGEPMDERLKQKMAIRYGVDVPLELPLQLLNPKIEPHTECINETLQYLKNIKNT